MARKVETDTRREGKKMLCGDACIERLPELCQGYEPQNLLNLDELGLFIKTLSEKGWMEKGKKSKVAGNLNNLWLLCSFLLLMALWFLNQLFSRYQKDPAIVSPLKIH